MRRFAAITTLAIGLGIGGASASKCTSVGVDLRGDWGQAHFNVEIADDPVEQAKGLMFREKLPASSGMLFIYDKPRHASFWMKNTLIPLDMLFLDYKGRVLKIKHNARPRDLTPIDGGADVSLVLEINAGLAKAMGITVGSALRHPSIEAAVALWPCP